MRLKICLLLSIWLLAAGASGATNTWIGGTSLDWFTPANWSESRVPTGSDAVVVPLYTTVHMNSNAVFAALELSGQLEGEVHVRTVLNWNLVPWDNGVIRTQLTIWPNAVVNIHDTGYSYPMIDGTCVNAGTIRKLGPGMIGIKNGELINTGVIEVQEGTLEIGSGLISNGTLAISNNAAVLLRGGLIDFGEGHRVTGNGRFAMAGDVAFQSPLRDRLDWLDGSLIGSLTISSNGVLNSPWRLGLGTIVTNYGLVNLAGAGRWEGGTLWYNAPSGLMSVWGGEVVYGYGTALINDGIIRCNSTVQLVNVDVEHYGSIEVIDSRVTMRGGRFQSDGRIFVEFGSVLSVTDGTLALREHHTVTGDGVFGVCDPDNGTTLIEDWIYSRLDLAAGALRGNIRIHSNAVLNVVSPSFAVDWHPNHGLDQGSITNYGTVNVSPDWPGWWWGENVRFYNAPSGVIEIGGGGWMGERGSGRASLFNEGVIRTIRTDWALYGGMEFWGWFTNAGVLELRGGPLHCFGFFVQTAPGSTIFHLDGTNSVSITATAYLAGHLAVSLPPDSQPAAGTTFEIMTFRDRVGEFKTVSGLGIAPGLRFDVLHQDTNVSLRVVVPQNRVSQPQFVENAFTFTFDGDPDRPYDIESSTNLVNWDRLYTTNSQTGLIPLREPQPFALARRFYRLRALP